MCGICGKVSWGGPVDRGVVQEMMNVMAYRGPDEQGMHVEPSVVLGHLRLSIIDLSTGQQPLRNEDGTISIIFNGEIYNYRELRQELLAKGHRFATTSDTEVIVHMYEELGERCVERLRGMFSFAIWDTPRKRLLLARDRVGIKPLYFTVAGSSFMFASEIKALLADPCVRRDVDQQGIDRFLTHFYMPGPETLLKGIQKLQPGHTLVLEDGKFRVRQYWDLTFPDEPRDPGVAAAVEELEELLKETVRGHMLSDVPVGVLLSGGVDSSGLLSYCAQETDKPIKTFTIGFSGEHVTDERPFARLAAERNGSTHYETTISADVFRDFLPKYVWHMEEPVCEPPAIALYYVTRLAREHVKVLISGEGGDEAFAGYQNYRNLVWLERLKSLGQPWTGLARAAGSSLKGLKPFSWAPKYLPLLDLPMREYYYSRTSGPFSVFGQWRDELYGPAFHDSVSSRASLEYLNQCFDKVAGKPVLSQMLYVDTKPWLPDDLLLKADKITMAHSVELRVPLLDHKVLEFAAGLHPSYKLHGVTTKYILKKALAGRVPEQIINRPKTGFPVPIQPWIHGELREFTRDTLLDRRSVERGYFSKPAMERFLDAAARHRQYAKEAFSLLVLELWHRRFVDASA